MQAHADLPAVPPSVAVSGTSDGVEKPQISAGGSIRAVTPGWPGDGIVVQGLHRSGQHGVHREIREAAAAQRVLVSGVLGSLGGLGLGLLGDGGRFRAAVRPGQAAGAASGRWEGHHVGDGRGPGAGRGPWQGGACYAGLH